MARVQVTTGARESFRLCARNIATIFGTCTNGGSYQFTACVTRSGDPATDPQDNSLTGINGMAHDHMAEIADLEYTKMLKQRKEFDEKWQAAVAEAPAESDENTPNLAIASCSRGGAYRPEWMR